jgi:hypothetical protein
MREIRLDLKKDPAVCTVAVAVSGYLRRRRQAE